MDGDEPGFRISYQRTPAWSVPSTSTVWVTTSDSWSPKFRYCNRYSRRSDIASTFVVVPGCGRQFRALPHMSESNGAVGKTATRENDDCDGVVQSAWNCQSWS